MSGPQIGIIGVPLVRVGVIGHAMRLVGNVSLCNSRITVHKIVKIALGFASCNYLTVTGTNILELHSNVCDYLYILVYCMYVSIPRFNASIII